MGMGGLKVKSGVKVKKEGERRCKIPVGEGGSCGQGQWAKSDEGKRQEEEQVTFYCLFFLFFFLSFF